MLSVRSRQIWLRIACLLAALEVSSYPLISQEQASKASASKPLSGYLVDSPLWTESFRSHIVKLVEGLEATNIDVHQCTFALAEPGHRQTIFLGEREEGAIIVVIDHIDLLYPDSYITVYDARWSSIAPQHVGLQRLTSESFYTSDGTPEGIRLTQLLSPLYLDYQCVDNTIEIRPVLHLSEEDKRNESLNKLIGTLLPLRYRWEAGGFVLAQLTK